MPFREAVFGGRSVGVPGVIAMLWMAHKQHGVRPWAELFEDAIQLAEDGFPVSPRLAAAVARDPGLPLVPASAAYFLPGGKPVVVGQILKNPAYAATLRLIAAQGPDGFYKGEVAKAIVDAVQNAPRAPQTLTLSDMTRYRAVKRKPVCGVYRAYRICGMGPPSSGGIAVLQILGMIEAQDVINIAPNSLRAVHLIAEAERLAFADRATYAADADFVRVPVKGMIDRKYLREARRVDRLGHGVDGERRRCRASRRAARAFAARLRGARSFEALDRASERDRRRRAAPSR